MEAPIAPPSGTAAGQATPAAAAKRPADPGPAYAAAWIVAGLLAAWCGWLLFSDRHAVIGRRALVYACLFACAPVVPMAAVFWWLNRFRPEPTRWLLVALIWGALIATYVALRLNGWLARDPGQDR